MKLLNVGLVGEEVPCVLDTNNDIRSLEGVCEAISSDFLANNGLEGLKAIDIKTLPVIKKPIRIGAPLLKPGKIIAVGLNYDEHIKETGSTTRRTRFIYQGSECNQRVLLTLSNDPKGHSSGLGSRISCDYWQAS